MLEDVRIVLTDFQAAIEIRFPFRLQYLSHFPAEQGRELRIRFQPVQIPESDRDAVFRRESVVPRFRELVNLESVDYEGDIDQGVYVTLRFSTAVTYEVTPQPDFTGVQINVVAFEPDCGKP